MKNIFFLARAVEAEEQLIIDEAKKHPIEFKLDLYSQLEISYQDESCQIKDSAGQDISKYDLIYFRNVGDDSERQAIVSRYCFDHQIAIYDPCFRYQKPWYNTKSFTYVVLRQNKLPIPTTFFAHPSSWKKFEKRLSYPCIVKATNQHQGQGVYLCHNPQEISRAFDIEKQSLLLQQYIANKFDTRIFVINGQVVGAEKRYAQKGEFRNNIALGGRGKKHTPSQEEIELALKATNLMGYSISGVDLVYDSSDSQWKILEVNRGPKFTGLMKATGINIPQLIIEFFIAQINH